MTRIAFVMDPLSSLNLKKDSTLAMLRAAQARGWDIVTPHHELATGFMAEGWARLKGKPALAIATPAMARPTSTLWVDNHWNAPVQVVVDHTVIGTLGGLEDGAVEGFADLTS